MGGAMKKIIIITLIFGIYLFSVNANIESFNYFDREIFNPNKINVQRTQFKEMPVTFFSTPYEKIIKSFQDEFKREKPEPRVIVKSIKKEIEKVSREIIITNDTLKFETVTIDVDQAVVWKNEQDKLQALIYGVRKISGMKSGYIGPGESFSWQFSEPGEYIYVDSVVIGRAGKIIVQ